jgi:hypothetical protein
MLNWRFAIYNKLDRMNLHAAFEAVSDEASFLRFVAALVADRRDNPAAWGSDSIEALLESGLAWAQATNLGATQGLGDASAWKRAAAFLYAGSVYE